MKISANNIKYRIELRIYKQLPHYFLDLNILIPFCLKDILNWHLLENYYVIIISLENNLLQMIKHAALSLVHIMDNTFEDLKTHSII